MPYSVTILVTMMPNLKLFSWAFHIKIIFRLKNVVLKQVQTFFYDKTKPYRGISTAANSG